MTMNFYAILQDNEIIAERDADELVPWWSFSKVALSAAALVLVRENKLSLDGPLENQPFTLRQLLRHQAGLTDYRYLPEYHTAVARGDDPWPVEELLERSRAQKLNYVPGNGWEYSNIGYMYVRSLIEAATGHGLAAALDSLIFQPMGIKSARVASTRADLEKVRMEPYSDYHPGWVYHGLLVGQLKDAARLLHGLVSGDILTGELLTEMTMPHPLDVPTAGRPWISPGYAPGLMVGKVASGETYIGHSGQGPGSVIAVYHRDQSRPSVTAAVFASGDDQGMVEKSLVDMLS